MKYVYECYFSDKPECTKCMLSSDNGECKKCMALGNRPKCPEEGCRKDCPLKLVIEENTGIFRRTDDLGRVVIPKEIRRKLGIKEGEPLDIFIVENGVLFKRRIEENKEEK